MEPRPTQTEAMQDRDLLRQFEAGHRAALSEFYQRHLDGLYLFLVSILKDSDAAWEALQNLAVDVCGNVQRFYEARDVRGYLFRSAAHEAYALLEDRQRRLRLQRAVEQRIQLFQPAARAADNEEFEALSSAILSLKPEWREVLILHVYDNFTLKETAEILNRPLSTVHHHFQSALSELKMALR